MRSRQSPDRGSAGWVCGSARSRSNLYVVARLASVTEFSVTEARARLADVVDEARVGLTLCS